LIDAPWVLVTPTDMAVDNDVRAGLLTAAMFNGLEGDEMK